MSNDSIADGGVVSPSLASPRRVFLNGADSLSDTELLSLVLSGGRATSAPLAAALLAEHGLAGVARLGLGELARARSVGQARALRVAAALELGRRAVQVTVVEASPFIPDHQGVVAWALPRLAPLDHEELWALALDGRHGLRAARRVASGGVHGLHIGVRDVLRVVLKEAASSFVLVHNHPSGDPTPSQEDIAFTRRVCDGAEAVGTPLLDHVIIARQRATSMFELGLVSPALDER